MKAGGDEQALRAGVVAADHGQVVPASRVLGRPVMSHLADVPVIARELLEVLVALRRGLARARRMALTAEDEQLAVGANRSRRLAGRDRHPVRRSALDA